VTISVVNEYTSISVKTTLIFFSLLFLKKVTKSFEQITLPRALAQAVNSMQSSTGTASCFIIALFKKSGKNICSFSFSVPVIAKALCRIHLPVQFTPAHGPLSDRYRNVQACALLKKNFRTTTIMIKTQNKFHQRKKKLLLVR
jgi:hypothetical protein